LQLAHLRARVLFASHMGQTDPVLVSNEPSGARILVSVQSARDASWTPGRLSNESYIQIRDGKERSKGGLET
jgi:hypothetical protein